MKLAVSNIGLPAHDHAGWFDALAELGVAALEVAPSRVWRQTGPEALTGAAVADYRRAVNGAGLAVCGLHSLFFDRPELTIFADAETRRATADFLVHLSTVCRDLGGRTMVFGSPKARRRGTMPAGEAMAVAADVFAGVATRIAEHGTCLCLEPLGPSEADFVNSARDSLALVERVDHPAFRVQLDFRALTANRELDAGVVGAVAGQLVHVHVNAADLGVIPSADAPAHARFAAQLTAAGYDGVISLEQRMVDEADVLGPLRASLAVVKEAYPI